MIIYKKGREYNIELKHMMHFLNIENVVLNGLLSHINAHKRGLVQNDISLEDVQKRRKYKKDSIYNRQLHEYVPCYFRITNPMLFRRKDINQELIILLIDADVLNHENVIFTDGNAASGTTKFFKGIENLTKLPLEIIFSKGYWNNIVDGKRIFCAEALIYPKIEISKVKRIVCPNDVVYTFVKEIFNKTHIKALNLNIALEVNSDYFF